MKFKVEIDVGNAAFEDENLGVELERILNKLASEMNQMNAAHMRNLESILSPGGEVFGNLRDLNGNRVGNWRFTNED